MCQTLGCQSVFPKDIHAEVCKRNPSLQGPYLQVSREMRKVALDSFLLSDKAIMEAIPSLLPEVKSDSITTNNALPLFKRLVNRLHDEAKHLECDQSPEIVLSLQERMVWECDHYQHLLQEVKQRMEIAKAEDFNKFVEVVAKAVEKRIPEGIDPREFWQTSLKHDKRIKEITSLNLFETGLRFIPAEISFFSNLESLYLGSNQIGEIPAEVASLSKLKLIDISHNQLERISEALPLPLNLEELRLNDNKLRKLPDAFKLLQRLKYLDLSHNPLEEISGVLSSLSKLVKLYLNHAGIKELPNNLTLPPLLKELYLTSNHITTLSKQALAALSQLRKLYLHHNPLNPETVSRLTNLLSVSPGKDIQWVEQEPKPTWGE